MAEVAKLPMEAALSGAACDSALMVLDFKFGRVLNKEQQTLPSLVLQDVTKAAPQSAGRPQCCRERAPLALALQPEAPGFGRVSGPT
jgi:hypothetical protein